MEPEGSLPHLQEPTTCFYPQPYQYSPYPHPHLEDSVVGIATFYRLDGSGIEFRWGRYFPHLSRQSLEPTQPPIRWIPGFLPGGKAAEVWR